jgi:hypothetical protein
VQLATETGIAGRQDRLEIAVLRHDVNLSSAVVPAKITASCRQLGAGESEVPIRLGNHETRNFTRINTRKSDFRFESRVERRATDITVLKEPT